MGYKGGKKAKAGFETGEIENTRHLIGLDNRLHLHLLESVKWLVIKVWVG
jgi:hypothetical protein